jgi:hypothetical protein
VRTGDIPVKDVDAKRLSESSRTLLRVSRESGERPAGSNANAIEAATWAIAVENQVVEAGRETGNRRLTVEAIAPPPWLFASVQVISIPLKVASSATTVLLMFYRLIAMLSGMPALSRSLLGEWCKRATSTREVEIWERLSSCANSWTRGLMPDGACEHCGGTSDGVPRTGAVKAVTIKSLGREGGRLLILGSSRVWDPGKLWSDHTSLSLANQGTELCGTWQLDSIE